jgi:sugar/nucleoside kinase (ribokinase family)
MAVGTFVVDYHKVLDHYPQERSSARVKGELISNGGAPLNTLVNLAKIGADFPLHAAAKVGQDLDGKLIVECCTKHGINTDQLIAVEGASTGYTDVFTVESSGQHTCFHYSGIGDTFARQDVKLRAVTPRILFLGSLGALGKLDQHNPQFGRRGATQLLRDARKQNITTAVEMAPTERHPKLAQFTESLAETDYLLINERLAEELTGVGLFADGQFDPELARDAAGVLLNQGIRQAVVIRTSVAAVYLNRDGSFHHRSGYLLPSAQRVGSAGVDHAFCAGFLEGLYHDKPIPDCLHQGLAVVASCRRHLTPSEGIPSLAECLDFYEGL